MDLECLMDDIHDGSDNDNQSMIAQGGMTDEDDDDEPYDDDSWGESNSWDHTPSVCTDPTMSNNGSPDQKMEETKEVENNNNGINAFTLSNSNNTSAGSRHYQLPAISRAKTHHHQHTKTKSVFLAGKRVRNRVINTIKSKLTLNNWSTNRSQSQSPSPSAQSNINNNKGRKKWNFTQDIKIDESDDSDTSISDLSLSIPALPSAPYTIPRNDTYKNAIAHALHESGVPWPDIMKHQKELSINKHIRYSSSRIGTPSSSTAWIAKWNRDGLNTQRSEELKEYFNIIIDIECVSRKDLLTLIQKGNGQLQPGHDNYIHLKHKAIPFLPHSEDRKVIRTRKSPHFVVYTLSINSKEGLKKELERCGIFYREQMDTKYWKFKTVKGQYNSEQNVLDTAICNISSIKQMVQTSLRNRNEMTSSQTAEIIKKAVRSIKDVNKLIDKIRN